jgi:hypothetical protein
MGGATARTAPCRAWVRPVATLVNLMTMDGRRALLHKSFVHPSIEHKELKTITPTGAFRPLIGVMKSFRWRVADGTRTHNNLNHNQALCH